MIENRKAIWFTICLYVMTVVIVLIADKLYTPQSANDIMGPPFMTMVGCFIVLLIFFFRSIYIAIFKKVSYWSVVVIHLLLMIVLVYSFML